jgi:hypothetical protein
MTILEGDEPEEDVVMDDMDETVEVYDDGLDLGDVDLDEEI